MNSLRIKLILPFVFGTLALTLSLAWYTYTFAKQEVVDAMLSISEAKTNHAVSSMSLMFESMTTALYNMVVDSHVISVLHTNSPSEELKKKTTEWLKIVTASNEYYRDIFIVDKNGTCIVSSNSSAVGQSFASEKDVVKALSGQFNIGDCSVGRVTKKFSVTIAGPIDVGDRVAGALIIVNDFPNIVDYGQKSTYDSQTVFTAFLTPTGMFAAHKDNNLMGNRNLLFSGLYNELLSVREQGEAVEYMLEGQWYVGYAKIEPTTKWVVVTSGKQSEVLESAYTMRFGVLCISAFFLCAVTFVVVRFATGILNSMFSLITYAKSVSEGDLDCKLEATRRTDELGVLHQALQRLVTTLKAILLETQKSSEMKGQFLANMSHEIRTPLNAIIGMAHLMRREKNLAGNTAFFIDKILISSRLLLGLINDILDLSKVEAGMIELERVSFDLKEIVLNTISIHQENARAKSLTLTLDYPASTPQRLIGDPLRIGQVLNNLLSNALKFTQTGGVNVVCLLEPDPQVEEASNPADNNAAKYVMLSISISDTGVGISPEAIQNLFQPFTQADASITRRFGGSGLGLTISKSLVSLMGGAIVIASEFGKGSTAKFTMRLEVQTSSTGTEVESPSNDEADAQQLEGKRVLVAEDNDINQLIMREMLQQFGAVVVIANHGGEAVELARQQHFDLILMDMQMPIMDGLEATRQIRALSGCAAVPIIALTANAMKEDKARCIASGMNGYLTKPIEPPVLISMLKGWMK